VLSSYELVKELNGGDCSPLFFSSSTDNDGVRVIAGLGIYIGLCSMSDSLSVNVCNYFTIVSVSNKTTILSFFNLF